MNFKFLSVLHNIRNLSLSDDLNDHERKVTHGWPRLFCSLQRDYIDFSRILLGFRPTQSSDPTDTDRSLDVKLVARLVSSRS